MEAGEKRKLDLFNKDSAIYLPAENGLMSVHHSPHEDGSETLTIVNNQIKQNKGSCWFKSSPRSMQSKELGNVYDQVASFGEFKPIFKTSFKPHLATKIYRPPNSSHDFILLSTSKIFCNTFLNNFWCDSYTVLRHIKIYIWIIFSFVLFLINILFLFLGNFLIWSCCASVLHLIIWNSIWFLFVSSSFFYWSVW